MVARAEQTLGAITIHPLSHSHASDQINTCVFVPEECNVTLFYRGVCILLAMRKHLAKVYTTATSTNQRAAISM